MHAPRMVQLHGIVFLLAFGWLSQATAFADEGERGQPKRPNVVLILCDDMGYSDIGCYGGEIDTPRLDELARDGLRFTQFYNNAKCTETRSALLSGLYHQQTNNLNKANHVTLAEVLRGAGYTTLMCGKWHVGGFNADKGTPPDRGFDRYFGFLGGAINFYTGIDYGSRRNLMRLDREVYEVPDDFYSTDAFTDYAIEFLNEASKKDRPFFLYLAHNAPHFPLHAPEKDIEKYRGKYMIGWDELRRRRRERMIEMGLIPSGWELSPRDELTPAWDSLSEKQQREEDHLMATYAAMIDRMDRQIGRVLDHLEQLGVADNTLVMFLSDNGGCPFDHNRTPTLPPGPAESYRTYDTEWAQASNTPFRLYKQWVHEGGMSTPMIVRWPNVVQADTLTRQPAHLIDIMPTLVELAGAEYPKEFNGQKVLPMEGRSLVPLLHGESIERGPMFWEYRGARAVREGKWKLVAERGKPWELYDLQADRSEVHNLIDEQPDRARRMQSLYAKWAKRIGARSAQQSEKMGVNRQDRYLYAKEKQ